MTIKPDGAQVESLRLNYLLQFFKVVKGGVIIFTFIGGEIFFPNDAKKY